MLTRLWLVRYVQNQSPITDATNLFFHGFSLYELLGFQSVVCKRKHNPTRSKSKEASAFNPINPRSKKNSGETNTDYKDIRDFLTEEPVPVNENGHAPEKLLFALFQWKNERIGSGICTHGCSKTL